MSADEFTVNRTGSDDPTADVDTAGDDAALEERLEQLQSENERLRTLYAQTRQSAYRRTALGLAAIGGVAGLGAVLFPAERDVLLILAAIGLFGGLLTYYLTPERFVAADVAERVYDALATTEADLAADLGLSDEHVYLPTGASATLFVPQHDTDPLPDPAAIEGPLVVTDETRGLAFTPSGARLFEEFDRTLSGPLADSPGPLARQVTDALAETFELVDGTDIDLDTDAGRCTVAIRGSAYPDGFDTPAASLLAVAFAVGLDQPIRVETAPAQAADFTVTCRWATDDTEDAESNVDPRR